MELVNINAVPCFFNKQLENDKSICSNSTSDKTCKNWVMYIHDLLIERLCKLLILKHEHHHAWNNIMIPGDIIDFVSWERLLEQIIRKKIQHI